MTVKVTVIVEIDDAAGHTAITRDATRGTGNPIYLPLETEEALVDAARSALQLVTSFAGGDIRDRPDAPADVRRQERPLTAPAQTTERTAVR